MKLTEINKQSCVIRTLQINELFSKPFKIIGDRIRFPLLNYTYDNLAEGLQQHIDIYFNRFNSHNLILRNLREEVYLLLVRHILNSLTWWDNFRIWFRRLVNEVKRSNKTY
jgi:hypothetical protein